MTVRSRLFPTSVTRLPRAVVLDLNVRHQEGACLPYSCRLGTERGTSLCSDQTVLITAHDDVRLHEGADKPVAQATSFADALEDAAARLFTELLKMT